MPGLLRLGGAIVVALVFPCTAQALMGDFPQVLSVLPPPLGNLTTVSTTVPTSSVPPSTNAGSGSSSSTTTTTLPKLFISVRTDKGIYKNGERVRLSGSVMSTGTLAPSNIVELRVRRYDLDWAHPVHAVLLDAKERAFADDGYVIQQLEPGTDDGQLKADGTPARPDWMASLRAVWFTTVTRYEVGARLQTGNARGNDTEEDSQVAYTSFSVVEIGYGVVLIILALLVALVFYVLAVVYLSSVGDATKPNARRVLLLVYLSALFFLLVTLGGPILISLLPAFEALLRTAPIGIVKVVAGKQGDLQWMLNIGGVVMGDNALHGGYGLPVFVVIMSLMGSVVSTLLQLPGFLRAYDGIQAGKPEEAEQVSVMRSAVLRQFMYLVAAPVLGMMLNSMAALADCTNPFAISLFALSVGFTSEEIVKRAVSATGKVLASTLY